jgi:sugar phosphate isomerase/epimerase
LSPPAKEDPVETIVCRPGPLDAIGPARYDQKEPAVPPLKIAVDLSTLSLPLQKALHMAAGVGAAAVEIDARGEITPQLSRTGVRQVRKMLDDLGLRVSAVRYRTRRGYAAMADLDVRVAATKAAMALAYNLGASLVTNHVGRIPSDPESPDWRLLVEVLCDLGEHGHRVGALLAAETGTSDGDLLARLLAALPEGALAVDLHPASLVQNGFSPLEAVAVLGPAIRLVHASDARAGSSGTPGEPAVLGRGKVDFPALLGALEEHDYRGYFTVGQVGSGDPQEEVSAAIEYLRRI